MDDATPWTSCVCPAAPSPSRLGPRSSGDAPDREAERLAALRRYAILDAAPSEAFNAITRQAAALFEVPVALISLVDDDRIWFLSRYGVEFEEVARDPGLCATLILSDAPYVLNDAAADPGAQRHPLVAGRFGLRFYAGETLVTPDGHAIGGICIIDTTPRKPRPGDLDALRLLASATIDRLEAHRLSIPQEAHTQGAIAPSPLSGPSL